MSWSSCSGVGVVVRSLALFACLVLVVPSSLAQSSSIEPEDLIISFQSIEGSELSEASYQVEILRWKAISELIGTTVQPHRMDEWAAASNNMTNLASVFDRNPNTIAALGVSLDELNLVMEAPNPFRDDGESALWEATRQAAVQELVSDSLRLFSKRTSSIEGIAALEIGMEAEAWSTGPEDSRIKAFLSAEQERLDKDLAEADALRASALDNRYRWPSSSNPLRLAALHLAQDQLQEAIQTYEQHGENELRQQASVQSSTVADDIAFTMTGWRSSVIALTAISMAVWGLIMWRLQSWNRQFQFTRQAHFLMGVQ